MNDETTNMAAKGTMNSEAVKSSSPVSTIYNIQAMRGIAAIAVFIGHGLLLQPGLGIDQYFSYFGVAASSGVDLFFVISGFIITTVAMKNGDEGVGGRSTIAWNFGVKRITRIYPVYWIVFILAFLLTPKINFAPPVTDIKPIAEQFFLVTHINSYIMSAWSLCFEIYFYAVVTIAVFISPRNVGKVLSVWAVGIIGIITYDYYIGQHGWIGLVPMSPMILEFIMGMIVACVIRKGFTGFAVTAAFVGIVGFMVGLEIMRSLGWSTLNPWYRTFYSGIPSAFIVYAFIALEYRSIWTFSRFWSKLGDASYSIYIWHQFIYYSILAFVTHQGWLGKVPAPVLFALWMVPALIFGFYSYKHIELSIQKKLNGWLLVRPGKDVPRQRIKRLTCAAALLLMIVTISGFSLMTVRYRDKVAQELSPLGNQVASLLASADGADVDDIESAAEKAGLINDDAIRGHFDGVYRLPQDVRVHGWAVDTRTNADQAGVLIFYCGQYLGLAPRGESRPDVAASLKVADGSAGFTSNLSVAVQCTSEEVEGLLVTKDKHFAVISARFQKV